LSNVDGATLKPVLALLLSVIGVRILVKFASPASARATERAGVGDDPDGMPPHERSGVKVAALIGGVTNGMIGAWGPVVTPFLLHHGVRPRFAIGSVNTAEVAVASASAVSLIASLGTGGFDIAVLAAMLVGGVVAAPVAAWLIRHLPPGPMGVAVASLLLVTNARELAVWGGLASGPQIWLIYAGVAGAVVLVLVLSRPRVLGATY
jgi:uncharacterized membrane protein YfcA